MAGQVIARGKGQWAVRVFLGRTAGRRRYLNKTVHGPKKAAEQVLTSTLRDSDTGQLVEPNRITVDAYLTSWLDTAAKARVRTRTFTGYAAIAKCYLRPTLGTFLL